MLTRMRFQNWRSLKDVTIENLTPITVFIGANSSGKTNIIDALRFRRHSGKYGAENAVQTWGNYSNILSFDHGKEETIEFEQSFRPSANAKTLTEDYVITIAAQTGRKSSRKSLGKIGAPYWRRLSHICERPPAPARRIFFPSGYQV